MLEVIQDKFGFPMVRADGMKFYIHWLPLSKLQIEYFLCQSINTRYFNRQWYDNVLSVNERISPHHISGQNFVNGLLTGVTASDIHNLIGGYGHAYDLPTEDEWVQTKLLMQEHQAIRPSELFQDLTFKNRTEMFLRKFNQIVNEAPTVAKQMLLADKVGVLEWVKKDGELCFIGIGDVILNAARPGDKAKSVNDPSKRNRNIGLRFILREDTW